MPYDSLVMAASSSEFQHKLLGSRVMKIYQPDKFSITMRFHTAEGNLQAYLSAHPVTGRAHFTNVSRENPGNPPLFCMVLRKHLEGGRLTAIEQLGWERILRFTFSTTDETGLPAERHLYLEIMGKHSNLILVDAANHTIIDGIRRYSHHLSRYREVLPGRPYLLPPPQEKAVPEELQEEAFREALLAQEFTLPLAKALTAAVSGLSPFLARELVARAGLKEMTTVEYLGEYDYHRLWQALAEIVRIRAAGEYQPVVLHLQGKPYDFAAIALVGVDTAEQHFYPTISAALDDFYQVREEQSRLESKQRELLKRVNTEIQRLVKKIALQEEDLAAAEAAEKYREAGELLTTYLYKIEKGMERIALPHFFEPEKLVEISLDPRLAPMDNIRHYFHRYNKAKNSKALIAAQLDSNREELAYVESILLALENCTDLVQLEEIKNEWVTAGYMPQKQDKKAQKGAKNQTTTEPFSYVIDGYTILAGRNNRQNDRLTLSIAAKDDIWLHTQKIPGSHVIIRKKSGEEIPEDVIRQGAAIAAWHSRAKNSNQVPVDYTVVAQVKKPGGAKPGMVIYFQQKTLYVTPNLPNGIADESTR